MIDRNNEIIVFVENALKDNNSIDIEDVVISLEVSKQDVFEALHDKGGYCIAGALTDYGTISKL